MIIQFICRAILLGVPLLYGSTGEIVTEKSGHLNLGIPGIMYVGAISGVVGSFLYENSCGNDIANMNPFLAVFIPLICAIIGAVLMGLIYSVLTVTLHANQNVTGLAITTLGIGLGNFLGASLINITKSELPSIALTKTSSFFTTKLPFADKLGWVGELLFSHDFLTYFAIIIAVVTAFVLKRTRIGLNLRSVGENPATADAAGINVSRYRYVATCIGSAIAGLGGLQYVMAYANGVWSNNAFGDRGWMAIALVIFALWNPSVAIIGSFVFGALCNANNYIPGLGTETQELFKMLPYLVTIIVLVIVSARKKREHQPPAHLGLPYFREER
ncbi:MAG: ABC transporter permease [Acutalibacteraceae bacterium]|nr:ABC transporter permease [Clostridia bacterium]MBQ2387338.1 ABC transporter permease [Clostridia bacterium]MBQ2420266.1 ABC transporter permease [Clostridia bacterium]MBQ5597029.1 ABC transporter permease [Clostridia bacterium]MEE1127758.1 ABC transporter permease [Acutalibacteraceae bacterium]